MDIHIGISAGISFEPNPFEDETPEEIRFYDLSGKEVSLDEPEQSA